MQMEEVLSRVRRTSKLWKLGELLAAEALELRGFVGIRNLNDSRHSQPYADPLAERAAPGTSSA